jgi:glycosyltransferase involved in cell wall biosynthesis
LLLGYFEYRAVLPWFTGPRPPLAGVVYDLIPLLFHRHYLADPVRCAWYARRFRRLADADALLTISAATARDLRRLAPDLPARVVNIAGATDPSFAPLAADEAEAVGAELRRRLGLRRDFLLFVGGDDYRKNMPGALRAYAALPPEVRRAHDLVLTCHLDEAARSALTGQARRLGVADRLRLTGFVSDRELRAMYHSCRLFVFPSLYEGLGLPVLEALRCGAPVVASDNSALPEYAGPASWLADGADPAALARAIQTALDEPRDARRAERLAFAARFTWERTAATAATELARLAVGQVANLPSGQAGCKPAPRRIAWLSPLPPVRSGIADYSAELLAPLAERFDMELVIDPHQPPLTPELASRFPTLPVNELAARHAARPYDLFVYHLGAVHRHLYLLEPLLRYRGLVVLHDFWLGGLVRQAAELGLWPVPLEEELRHEGEDQMADWMRGPGLPDWVAGEVLPLNRRLLESAAGVLVHSDWALRRVRRVADVPAACVPLVMPVPELRPAAEERRRLGLSADEFVVCTLGQVGHAKRVHSILRAVAALPEGVRGHTRLVVVGDGEPGMMAGLARLAAELRVGERVRYTGHVSLADFSAYARAADVCVQLRYPVRGESSAAVLRALAAGAACVTSDEGPMAELPDEVTWKVRSPHHEVADLAAALTRLHAEPALRRALAEAGLRHVREVHSLGRVVGEYARLVEGACAWREAHDEPWDEQARQSLRPCPPDEAEALLARWRDLRRQARRPNASSPGSAQTLPFPPSAAPLGRPA